MSRQLRDLETKGGGLFRGGSRNMRRALLRRSINLNAEHLAAEPHQRRGDLRSRSRKLGLLQGYLSARLARAPSHPPGAYR